MEFTDDVILGNFSSQQIWLPYPEDRAYSALLCVVEMEAITREFLLPYKNPFC